MIRTFRTAVIGAALAASAAAVLVPAATAASAAPVTTRASATKSTGPYGGFSTGSIAHVSAVGVVGTTVANLSLGQSSAGTAIGQPLVKQDKLGSSILTASTAGKNSYGHGSGANVGLLENQAAVPQIALTRAEALSPPPKTATATELLTLPLAPLATVQVLPSTAKSLTTAADTSCPGAGAKLISQGKAQIANAQVLAVTPLTPVVGLGGTSDSVSETGLVAPTGSAQGQGLSTRTTQTLAPLTLFQGIPGAEIKIEVLHKIALDTTAGGVAGSAKASYGFVGIAPTDNVTPVLRLTVAGTATTLTSQQLLGNGGLKLALGVADVFIGAPAHGLDDNPLSSPTVNGDGTSAAAAADFIRIKVPGTVAVGAPNPIVGGPLASLLNPILTPVTAALSPVLTPLQAALTSAGLNVADVRYGHLEAATKVPAGGIICTTDTNPLSESRKDVSALSAPAGGTFDYTVRFPNRGTSTITKVKVVDTYADGLEFQSSVPAPTSRSGNTLTYDLPDLAPGAFAQIQLTFKVPADAKVGTKYKNTAVISGVYNGDPVTTTVVAEGPTVIPTPSGPCDVSSSTKYASNTKVKTGENFGYFVNVANTGGKACTDIVVTDVVPAGTNYVSCTDGCKVDGRTVTWTIPSLSAGSSQTLSFVVKVTATSGTLPNVAVVNPGNPGVPTARPRTNGPTVTTVSTPRPGAPAGCPATGCPDQPSVGDKDLPRTGLSETIPLLGALLLGFGALGMRRRRAL